MTRHYKHGIRTVTLFDERRTALQREVKHHPQLLELLANHPQEEFEVILAEISSYCNVALDGYYGEEDLNKLCGILYEKLKAKRGSLIIGITSEARAAADKEEVTASTKGVADKVSLIIH